RVVWAGVGAELGRRADAEATTFYVRGMSQYLERLLQGLERCVSGGMYAQDELEAWARRRGHMLARPSVRAERRFERAWREALFGPGHPYARDGDPTQDSLGEIGHDALLAWKAQTYVARNATLIVVGDFDAFDGAAAVRKRFGDWREGTAAPAPPPPPRTGGRAPGGVTEHPEMGPVAPGFPGARPPAPRSPTAPPR